MAAAEAVGWSGRVGSGKKGVRIDMCMVSAGREEGRKGKEKEKEKEKKEKGGGLTTLFCFAYGMVEGRIDVGFFSAWGWLEEDIGTTMGGGGCSLFVVE